MINPYKEQSKVNPQREKGRREIANDCYQALIKARLAGAVYQIVLTVIDKTWGFNQTESPIALSDFQDATGLSRQGIIKSLKIASQLHLIIVEKHGGARNSNIYMFNKYYDTWLSSSQPALTPSSQLQCTPETDSAVNCSIPEQSTSVDPSSQPALTPSSQPALTPLGGIIGGVKKKKETIKETIKERVPKSNTDFPEFINTDIFDKYLEMRKKTRHPATDYAIELIIKQLKRFHEKGQDVNAVIEQSIMHGWTGLFELKNNGGNGNGAHQQNTRELPAEYTDPAEYRKQYRKRSGVDEPEVGVSS